MHIFPLPRNSLAMAFSPDRQPARPFCAGSKETVVPLRPYWGLQPARRGYDIRPARTPHQHGMASMLVRRMYAWRGYTLEAAAQHTDDSNRLTLSAWRHDEVVATLTLRRDSPSGLSADALYSEELATLRCPERVVCEVTRLAVDPEFSSPELLSGLFRAAFLYGKASFSASDAIFEVNPRHSRFYQQRFGFRQIGGLRQCQRVNAPAVLLHQRLEEIAFPEPMIAIV